MNTLFTLRVLTTDGVVRDCTWPPRSLQSATALARYMQRLWPDNQYFIAFADRD